MSLIVRRSSLHIINQSSIPTLVKRVQKADHKSADRSSAHHAHTILTYVSKHCPGLYKPHVGELVKAIADEKNPMLVEISLQALSAAVRWDEKLAPHDKSVLLILISAYWNIIHSYHIFKDARLSDWCDTYLTRIAVMPNLHHGYLHSARTEKNSATKL